MLLLWLRLGVFSISLLSSCFLERHNFHMSAKIKPGMNIMAPTLRTFRINVSTLSSECFRRTDELYLELSVTSFVCFSAEVGNCFVMLAGFSPFIMIR